MFNNIFVTQSAYHCFLGALMNIQNFHDIDLHFTWINGLIFLTRFEIFYTIFLNDRMSSKFQYFDYIDMCI